MGLYLNPSDMSKEEWLKKNAVPLSGPPQTSPDEDGYYAVCYVDNGLFTAAGLAFNHGELMAFDDPLDKRPKRWFLVDSERAKEFE